MFSKSLEGLESFCFMLADSFFESKGRRERNIKRGYKFFSEAYVHDVWVKAGDSIYELKAKCYKSQKKNERPHNLWLKLSSTDGLKIDEAHCSCEAGASQSCNHLVALAYLIQHLVHLGHAHIPEDVSCTSIAQQWSKPRGPEIISEPVMGVCFTAPSEAIKKKNPVRCSLYEARPKDLQDTSLPEVNLLANSLRQINPRIAASYLLASCSDSFLPPPPDQPTFCRPIGSVISYQLEKFSIPKTPLQSIPNPLDYLSFPIQQTSRDPLFGTVQIPHLHPNFHKIELDQNSAIDLENNTRQQTHSTMWKTERETRLTASNFGEVEHRRKVPSESFIKKLLVGVDLKNVPQIRHGIENEGPARQRYIEYKKNQGSPVSVYRSGLVVNPLAPHLGASPDGHVIDGSCSPDLRNGVLEIKCPSSKKYSNLEGALKCNAFCLEFKYNKIQLKISSNYNQQIQGQMMLCGVTWCDFVVYLKCSDELFVQRIPFDETACVKMYKTLTDFYVKYLFDRI